MNYDQFNRKIGVVLYQSDNGNAKDFSNFRVSFEVQNSDAETPNNAVIRIYGLSKITIIDLITKDEFSDIALSAGYVNDNNFAIIFKGQIKQYRHGKEDATTTFLDILAADGDAFYNQTFINESISAGIQGSQANVLNKIAKDNGLDVNYNGVIKSDNFHQPSIRGKVLWGMPKVMTRNIARSINCGWSIQNGVLQVVDNRYYLNNEVVELNSETGLVGMPELTDEGIRMTCLLNCKLVIGSLVKLNNSIINRTDFTKRSVGAEPYNRYKAFQHIAPLDGANDGDGYYRLFVVEHEGDTRGNNWYSHIIALAMDFSHQEVSEYPSQNPNTINTQSIAQP